MLNTDICSDVQGLVISQISYCNALYVGPPLKTSQRLQWVQNVAARLVADVRKFGYITPVLANLHWLPIFSWVRMKDLTLRY